MKLKMTTVAVILLTTFTVADFARVRRHEVKEREKLEKQSQIAAQNNEAFTDEASSAADGAEADSAGASANHLESQASLAAESVSHSSVISRAFNVTVAMQLGVVTNQPPSKKRNVQTAPSIFSKTLGYVSNLPGGHYSQEAVLKAACDSKAFSCEEIIQLTNGRRRWNMVEHWIDSVKLFAEARNNSGCISDPANAKSIVDSLEGKFNPLHPMDALLFRVVLPALFIDNDGLLPAKDLGPTPKQLQTGLRTDKDMEKLLGEMAELQLIRAYTSQGSDRLDESRKLQFIRGHWVGGLYQAGSPSVQEFESRLEQIRAKGEQFSGSQLVSLIEGIPNAPLRGRYIERGKWRGRGLPERNWTIHEKRERNSGTAQAASVLLQYLEQYVTGVTCAEVKRIIQHALWVREDFFVEGLDALKSNIVDGQNKVDIVAFTDAFGGYNNFQTLQTERVLRYVGVGLPPKNNPVFGVVKGNPVIFVLEESTSMDAVFTLGDDKFTRRKFCNRQLETVLEGLPDGTYFNVIQYSGSAVKIFPKAVLASKTNINEAMEAMGTTWRGDYTPGQEPIEMLRHVKAFALKLTHRLNRSSKRNSMEALRLAYATADMPSRQTGVGYLHHHRGFVRHSFKDFWRWTPKPLAMTAHLPQIYFLTTGQPEFEAIQILDKIDEFDKGRKIPVNSIAFITPVEVVAKQFAKDLAQKTGGFFRSIEQSLASLYTNKRKRKPTEHIVWGQTESNRGNQQKQARGLAAAHWHGMKARRMNSV